VADWEDLRFFLAIARAGSLAGAARALVVNHSTMFRRLNAMEDRLGVRLFERLPQGMSSPAPVKKCGGTHKRPKRPCWRRSAASRAAMYACPAKFA
jgi:hypothetical protein